DTRAREFFQIKLLAGIEHQQQLIDFNQFAATLRKLNEQLAAHNLATYFDDLSTQLSTGFAALRQALLELQQDVAETRQSAIDTKQIAEALLNEADDLPKRIAEQTSSQIKVERNVIIYGNVSDTTIITGDRNAMGVRNNQQNPAPDIAE